MRSDAKLSILSCEISPAPPASQSSGSQTFQFSLARSELFEKIANMVYMWTFQFSLARSDITIRCSPINKWNKLSILSCEIRYVLQGVEAVTIATFQFSLARSVSLPSLTGITTFFLLSILSCEIRVILPPTDVWSAIPLSILSCEIRKVIGFRSTGI